MAPNEQTLTIDAAGILVDVVVWLGCPRNLGRIVLKIGKIVMVMVDVAEMTVVVVVQD